MSPIDSLVPVLKKLRMSGVLTSLQMRSQEAVEDSLSHSEFLLRLLTDEVERREAKMLEQRIRRANFENSKTLEDFDFLFNPGVPKAKVIDLASCNFVGLRKNVILMGKSGVGKSHIAQALGHRACLRDYKVRYTGAQDMLKQLRSARGDNTYERRLLKYTQPDLLIIDDLGLRQLVQDEPIDLYEIIRLRYERGSVILTSNRALEELPELFGDPLLASAAMDRLLEDAHIIEIEGDSYRNPPPNKRRTKSSKRQEQGENK